MACASFCPVDIPIDGTPLGFTGTAASTIQVEGYQPRPGENMAVTYIVATPGYFNREFAFHF
jgi:hypothetical protein